MAYEHHTHSLTHTRKHTCQTVTVFMMFFVFCRCVNSRWDRPKADVLPNESRGTVSSPADPSEPPQGGVEMAAVMAAKINAMLMAKGKLKPLQPLPSKVLTVPQSHVPRCPAVAL